MLRCRFGAFVLLKKKFKLSGGAIYLAGLAWSWVAGHLGQSFAPAMYMTLLEPKGAEHLKLLCCCIIAWAHAREASTKGQTRRLLS